MRPIPTSPASSSDANQHGRARARAWPFVGRDDELAHGLHRLATPGGVALYGDAGVGKTRLASRIAEVVGSGAGATGHALFRVSIAATEARRHIPLSALEPLLGDLTSGGPGPALGIGAELADRLRSLAGGDEVLVQVDDAHLLDDASADALAALCRLGRTRLLLTVRTDVAVPSAFTALWKDEVIDPIDLEPFDLAVTTGLLIDALNGEVTHSASGKMWSATKGNPLHIRELTRDGLDDGSLVFVDGVWTWQGDLGPGHRMGDLVSEELRHLSPAEREVVDLVALAEPVPVSTLVVHAEPGALDSVIERGLVILDRPSDLDPGASRTARLLHPLYAESVRARVGPDRRRRLFNAVVQQERVTPQEPLPSLMRSVAWALECDLVPDVDRLLRATRAAVLLGHLDYALRMASTAVEHLHRERDGRIVDALILRARSWRRRGEPDRARTDLERAREALTHVAGSPARLVKCSLAVAEARAELAQFVDDDPDQAASILDEVAVDLAGTGDPTQKATWDLEMDARRLTSRAWAGRSDISVDAGLEVLASSSLDSELRLPLVAPIVLGLVARGRFDAALALSEAELPSARANPDAAPWALADIAAARFTALLCAGRIHEMAGPFAGSTGDHDELLRFDRTLQQIGAGLRAAAEGRWEDAHRELRAAAVAFDHDDQRGLRANALAQLARSSVATGRMAEARQAIAEFRSTPLRASRAVGGQLRLAVAAAAVALAEPDVLDDLTDLADEAARRGERYIELSALHLLAIGHSTADDGEDGHRAHLLRRVRALDGTVDPPVGPLLVQHAESVLTDQTVLANALASSLARAGVWLPPTSLRVELSPRQREVASLAANGFSSREIATHLHLSVRTVDTHLAHVFTKLGINRRSALAAALAGLETAQT